MEQASPQARHPHPLPARAEGGLVIVGGGHAGVEAALAASRLGVAATLVSFRADRIGEMSCNPAIGGLGKGQLAREVDALGGLMGAAIDATGIQFRMLNTAKGHAVRAPRAQADRHRYREEVTRRVLAAPGVEVLEAAAAGLLVTTGPGGPSVVGVRLEDGRELRAAAVLLTTGTFLRAIMHTGEAQSAGGRVGEASSDGLSGDLLALGLPTGRLKTGTPPRLAADSVDWDALETQGGDAHPVPFSFLTDPSTFPSLPQVPCHVTYTHPGVHDIIRANIGRAPMYSGQIQGIGPRYCPSIEDKVMRFADRERHQLFLEPEGLDTDVIYVNGVSTSLPAEVQEEFLRAVPGLARARFLRHGYAVEYDFVQPSALDHTLAATGVAGLYLAGQINGTSGYEEAAAQGLLAGANAALWMSDRAPFVLARHEAYAGVLIDDLVVSQPTEPYRMFSSRAEYRLLLRQDDADRRLTLRAAEIGLVDAGRASRARQRARDVAAMVDTLRRTRLPSRPERTLAQELLQPTEDLASLVLRHPELSALAASADVLLTAEADVKYAGYVERQRHDVERLRRQETTPIPAGLDYAGLTGLRNEAREKLTRLRPGTLGAAGRISGINPPDVALLAVHVERHRRRIREAEADQACE